MATTYAVIESTIKGDKLHGVFRSLASAIKKRNAVDKSKSRTSFGSDIYKFYK